MRSVTALRLTARPLLALVGAALDELAGASGADVNAIAAGLGDSVVRVLGAALPLASLRALRDVAAMPLADPAAQAVATAHGATAKSLPPLRGKRRENAGRAPSSAESAALGGRWLAVTHVPFTP